MTSVVDHATHTPYSYPGRHADLFSATPTDPASLAAVARNIIVHYRASGHELPDHSRNDINSRWLEAILTTDQHRHPGSLEQTRPLTERVQGCCRDHTLFCVGVLRSRGIPARSRVGFAGYFVDGWHHDHVVIEAWFDGRWRRFDSEIENPIPGLPTPMDMPNSSHDSAGFVTAAQVWIGYRKGDIDAESYGIDPDVPILRGERFLFDEVIHEVAHRFGDELLLWDVWGRMAEPGTPVGDTDARWLDEVAHLLVASDAGEADAERSLLQRYRKDEGLHPSVTISQASPNGDPPIAVSLQR